MTPGGARKTALRDPSLAPGRTSRSSQGGGDRPTFAPPERTAGCFAAAPTRSRRASASGPPLLRVRFLASDLGAGSVVEAGVDGVNVFTYVCDETVFGDLNDDGIVGINDFLILLAEWGPCADPCPPYCLGDIDENCDVGINDLLLLLANWT